MRVSGEQGLLGGPGRESGYTKGAADVGRQS